MKKVHFFIALVIICMAQIVNADISLGLAAHWKFDETSGDTAYDSAGDNDATLYGNVTWMAGKISGALHFGGNGGDHVLAPADIIDAGNPFSIFMWVMLENKHGSYTQMIIRQHAHSGILMARFSSTDKINSYLGAENSYSSTAIFQNTNEWHHIGITHDGSFIRFYVDGQIDGSNSINAWNKTDGFRIGAAQDPSSSRGSWEGLMDDIRIYNRALSDEEVWELYIGVPEDHIPVAVDIKPGSCPNPVNVKSKGVLPVAILGTEEFEVSAIDPASIFLNGAPAIRSSYEDVAGPVANPNECECTTDGPDGFDDLTLKFYTQEIVETLGEVNTGDILTLPLTGVLNDETPIEGADCIVICGKHKPLNKADINEDGVVNMADFMMMSANWLESSIVEE